MKSLIKAVTGKETANPDQQLYKKIKAAVARLDEHEQIVVTLRYEHDLSVKEIAQQTRYSTSSIYTYLNRALILLKKQFHPESFQPMYDILYPENKKPIPFNDTSSFSE